MLPPRENKIPRFNPLASPINSTIEFTLRKYCTVQISSVENLLEVKELELEPKIAP